MFHIYVIQCCALPLFHQLTPWSCRLPLLSSRFIVFCARRLCPCFPQASSSTLSPTLSPFIRKHGQKQRKNCSIINFNGSSVGRFSFFFLHHHHHLPIPHPFSSSSTNHPVSHWRLPTHKHSDKINKIKRLEENMRKLKANCWWCFCCLPPHHGRRSSFLQPFSSTWYLLLSITQ